MNYLPCGDYEWVEPKDYEAVTDAIKKWEFDQDEGYIICCDLGYPQHLHKLHDQNPLAPEKKTITYKDLSPYSRQFVTKRYLPKVVKAYEENIKKYFYSYSSVKLVSTLQTKESYTLHYMNLKLYLDLGMTAGKIHKILRFRQAPLARKFIEDTTLRRSLASIFSNYLKLVTKEHFYFFHFLGRQ